MSGALAGISQGIATARRTIGAATAVVSGTIGVVNDVSSLLGGGPLLGGLTGGTWFERLQPASWRGIPFAVRSSEYTGGRRIAVHEYPFRDLPWAEDLGRATRAFGFSAFVVGDDCVLQARSILAAGETKGPGTLIHPSLGLLTVVLVAPIRATERGDLGRVVELSFEFIQVRAAAPIFPAVSADSASAAQAAASAATTATGSTFLSSIGSAISSGASAIGSAVRTVTGFTSTVGRLVGDASLVTHAVAGLVPATGTTFGRYSSGARGSSLLTGISTASQAIGAVTTARTAVASACSSCASLAAAL